MAFGFTGCYNSASGDCLRLPQKTHGLFGVRLFTSKTLTKRGDEVTSGANTRKIDTCAHIRENTTCFRTCGTRSPHKKKINK